MSLTDVNAPDTSDDVQLLKAKASFVLHELVDRVAHTTESDRLAMHQQVTELCDGVSHAAARDSVADPAAYLEAHGNGAYDVPEPAPGPLTPDQIRIQQLQAQIDAMSANAAAAPMPATPPEQSPATSTAQPAAAVPPTSTPSGQPSASPSPTAAAVPDIPTAATGENAQPAPAATAEDNQPPVTGAPDAPSS